MAIECCPSIAGLFVEILELRCPDSVGGHRIRIALRAQGVMPSVSIEGLLPPPANWGLRANQVLLSPAAPSSHLGRPSHPTRSLSPSGGHPGLW